VQARMLRFMFLTPCLPGPHARFDLAIGATRSKCSAESAAAGGQTEHARDRPATSAPEVVRPRGADRTAPSNHGDVGAQARKGDSAYAARPKRQRRFGSWPGLAAARPAALRLRTVSTPTPRGFRWSVILLSMPLGGFLRTRRAGIRTGQEKNANL